MNIANRAWISGQELAQLVILTPEQQGKLESIAKERTSSVADALDRALVLLESDVKPVAKRGRRKQSP